MKRVVVLSSTLALAGFFAASQLIRVAGKPTVQAASDRETQAVVTATSAFLKTLSPEQRHKVVFAFTPQKTGTKAAFHQTADGSVAPGAPAGGQGEPGGPGGPGGPNSDRRDGPPSDRKPMGPPPGGRGRGPDGQGGPRSGFGMGPPGGFIGEQYGQAVWSNYPVSDVPRPGLRMGMLSAPQRSAAMHLLQTVLSPMGYQKVLDIMGSDQALTDAGTNFASGEAVYTIGIFGEPSEDKPWMIEFGGHHLGLNVVLAGSKGVMTPTLTGAQPAVYKRGAETIRVLAKENDMAFDLLDSLRPEQKKKAILDYEVRDLVLGPGVTAKQLEPEGLKGSELNAKQQSMLVSVIAQWAGIMNSSYADPRMEEIRSSLNDSYFAWSGPTTHAPGQNGTSYYRIQGPKLVIEFSPQGVGGDPAMHVHTIYRDPTNDYGVKFTGAE